MEGRVALKKDTAASIRYRNLPKGAKLALGQAALRLDKPEFFRSPPTDEVPNPIYRIGRDKAVFLLAPASAEEGERLEQSCALMWKGDHFLEARKFILPEGPGSVPLPRSLPKDNPFGLAYVSTTTNGLLLTVAALQGWTVLKSTRAEPVTPGVP